MSYVFTIYFPRMLIADREGTPMQRISYYGSFPGSGVHLSLNPLGTIPCDGKCIREYAAEWLDKFSTNKWPTWVVGYEI